MRQDIRVFTPGLPCSAPQQGARSQTFPGTRTCQLFPATVSESPVSLLPLRLLVQGFAAVTSRFSCALTLRVYSTLATVPPGHALSPSTWRFRDPALSKRWELVGWDEYGRRCQRVRPRPGGAQPVGGNMVTDQQRRRGNQDSPRTQEKVQRRDTCTGRELQAGSRGARRSHH